MTRRRRQITSGAIRGAQQLLFLGRLSGWREEESGTSASTRQGSLGIKQAKAKQLESLANNHAPDGTSRFAQNTPPNNKPTAKRRSPSSEPKPPVHAARRAIPKTSLRRTNRAPLTVRAEQNRSECRTGQASPCAGFPSLLLPVKHADQRATPRGVRAANAQTQQLSAVSQNVK